ncbi:uncharacterized protein N7518_008181 [Penicillium psychrosexuale]|uniref:uncharacterized protein n=1 Tax=Penicillium psychrosexuale TaxID=1002107 RepID=UPI0025458C63|nr:uncharacterized protein N7518_008181 [Penicillium psychrosexuale]KAJ5791170.1 hypothetical protein N7518_008181 [Penicillium psychrosexuale]
MRFFIWAFATVLGLALASPIEAGKGVALSSRSNNCFTLCKIDGGLGPASTMSQRKAGNAASTAKTAPGVHESRPITY